MKKIIITTLTLCIFATGCGVNSSPGDGEKIGQIVRIKKVGLFTKTWEAEIIRGGMNGGSGAFGVVPFLFTVEKDEDAQKCIDYMRNQTEVNLKYRTEFLYSVSRSESGGDFLTSISPSK